MVLIEVEGEQIREVLSPLKGVMVIVNMLGITSGPVLAIESIVVSFLVAYGAMLLSRSFLEPLLSNLLFWVTFLLGVYYLCFWGALEGALTSREQGLVLFEQAVTVVVTMAILFVSQYITRILERIIKLPVRKVLSCFTLPTSIWGFMMVTDGF